MAAAEARAASDAGEDIVQVLGRLLPGAHVCFLQEAKKAPAASPAAARNPAELVARREHLGVRALSGSAAQPGPSGAQCPRGRAAAVEGEGGEREWTERRIAPSKGDHVGGRRAVG
jgi:hypothetical protein